MKKIYLLTVLLLALLNAKAQIDTTTLAGKYEYIFEQLDRNQIPTGFIDERAFPLISLAPFNGVLTDSNKVNIDTWRGLYFTLSSACLLNQNPFAPITVVNSSIATYSSAPNISTPVAMLLGKYNTVKSYAFSSNLLSISNDQVLDVPNRTENPYLTQSLFAASPAKSNFPDENFSFVFTPALFYTNSSLTVNTLYIDFDDGYGYRSASWDTAISPAYTSSGDKTVKFKMVMSDNSIYECYSKINIAKINNIQLLSYNPNNPSFTQTFNATTNHSGGNAIVRLSVNNSSGHIQKPLIVVEGYDASSVAPTLSGGNYTYRNFVRDIDAPSQTYNFNQQLDDTAGYDLVFLDYANGTDDIVRNAALLQEVITWVNSEKALVSSTEQNVVMGVSMGGLVARYALANMTKNNIATQTRLLITHDSPHQGANVPVGLQKLAFVVGSVDIFGYKIRDVFPSYQEAVDVLNAPATAELLKYRVTSEFSSIANNTFLSSVYKPMITFSSSDPQPTYRFIATSQGSECGMPLFAPGSNILNIQGGADVLIPFALSTAKASLEIKANALPNIGSSATIAKVRFMAKVKLFGFITIAKDFYNYTSNITSSTFLPIDGSTGGTSPIGSLDASGAGASGDVFLLYNYRANLNTATISNFCFVPTASALDVDNFDNASLTAKYVSGWSPSNPSSAETFIAQEVETVGSSSTFNERHTQFTARNANWLFNEMENVSGNTLNCSINCSANTSGLAISGSNTICNGSGSYQLEHAPVGAIITWSATGNTTFAGGVNTGSSITINNAEIENITLTATISAPCGNIIKTKDITVGIPGWYATVFNSSTGPSNYFVETDDDAFATVDPPYPNAISYHWEMFPYPDEDYYIQNGLPVPSGNITGSSSSVTIEMDVPGVYRVSVKAVTACGETEPQETYFEAVEPGSLEGMFSYNIYPNPASSELTVSYETVKTTQKNLLNQQPKQSTTAKSYHVQLISDKGTVLRDMRNENDNSKIVINTLDIPNGIYYLHIFHNSKKVIKKQIIIKH